MTRPERRGVGAGVRHAHNLHSSLFTLSLAGLTLARCVACDRDDRVSCWLCRGVRRPFRFREATAHGRVCSDARHRALG